MRHHGPVSKAEVRALIRAGRRARPVDERARCAAAIAARVGEVLPRGSLRVTCYRSLPTEPGTTPLIESLRERGHRVFLPRIDGVDLRWVCLHDDTRFSPGPMGILEPDGPGMDASLLPALDVLLLPGLAVDVTGHRLGQGGGFYDRALADVPRHAQGGPLRIAVLYDDEVLDTVPTDAHDCSVDVVVTPERVVRFR
jgi:5-formyltetrahydrofolate cyclo-ligase